MDFDFDPYGRMTKVQGDKDSPFTYTGHFWHAPSGLNLTKYRAYDPNLGRWVSRDPIGEGDGPNLYIYVENDGINLSDPSGLKAWKCRRHLGKKPGMPPPPRGDGKQHRYYCVQDTPGGPIKCYGHTSSSKIPVPWETPGRPTTPEEDFYHKNNCEEFESSPCFEKCIKEWGECKDRPNYPGWGVPSSGTNCHGWVSDVFNTCNKQCDEGIPSW